MQVIPLLDVVLSMNKVESLHCQVGPRFVIPPFLFINLAFHHGSPQVSRVFFNHFQRDKEGIICSLEPIIFELPCSGQDLENAGNRVSLEKCKFECEDMQVGEIVLIDGRADFTADVQVAEVLGRGTS